MISVCSYVKILSDKIVEYLMTTQNWEYILIRISKNYLIMKPWIQIKMKIKKYDELHNG